MTPQNISTKNAKIVKLAVKWNSVKYANLAITTLMTVNTSFANAVMRKYTRTKTPSIVKSAEEHTSIRIIT